MIAPEKDELRCTRCKQVKPLSSFNRDSGKKSGYQYQCKDCRKIRSKQYYKDNREKILSYQKQYNRDNYNKNKVSGKDTESKDSPLSNRAEFTKFLRMLADRVESSLYIKDGKVDIAYGVKETPLMAGYIDQRPDGSVSVSFNISFQETQPPPAEHKWHE